MSLRAYGAHAPLHVAVLCCDMNSPLKGRADEDFDYLGADDADRAFRAALEQAGYIVSWHPVHLLNVEDVVRRLDCDIVFNLCDGSGPGRDNAPGLEAIAALESRQMPYTGATAKPYRITISKPLMKERFVERGIQTPSWQLFTAADAALDLALRDRPLFVKPSDAGGSAGVSFSSIIPANDGRALRAQLAVVIDGYGEALVEEYIRGREITVGLLGSGAVARALPPLEVRFGDPFPSGSGIRTHESKWDTGSPCYGGFELLCPAPLTPTDERSVLHAARMAYDSVGGVGYGRVDMRLDDRGPFVLEVNMNCYLQGGDDPADDGVFTYAARSAGITFTSLLQQIVDDGRRRG